MIICQRPEYVGDLSDEIDQDHAQKNTVGMLSDAFLENDIVSYKQRDKHRCNIKFNMIHISPEGGKTPELLDQTRSLTSACIISRLYDTYHNPVFTPLKRPSEISSATTPRKKLLQLVPQASYARRGPVRTLQKLFGLALQAGIEPASTVPETAILSIRLLERAASIIQHSLFCCR